MINRFEGEIHINPIRVLRNDDFNNDGRIKDIEATLDQAIELNQQISKRLFAIKALLKETKYSNVQFSFAEGGYISIKGLSDARLKELSRLGYIELFDNATSKEWVKKHGHHFGLVWENGRAMEL